MTCTPLLAPPAQSMIRTPITPTSSEFMQPSFLVPIAAILRLWWSSHNILSSLYMSCQAAVYRVFTTLCYHSIQHPTFRQPRSGFELFLLNNCFKPFVAHLGAGVRPSSAAPCLSAANSTAATSAASTPFATTASGPEAACSGSTS